MLRTDHHGGAIRVEPHRWGMGMLEEIVVLIVNVVFVRGERLVFVNVVVRVFSRRRR